MLAETKMRAFRDSEDSKKRFPARNISDQVLHQPLVSRLTPRDAEAMPDC
jgi:hypothetical protein